MLLPFVCSSAQETKRQKGETVPPAVIPHKFEGKVAGVLDGDTIRVANAEIFVVTIRLEGIDAPGTSQEFGYSPCQHCNAPN